MLSDAERLVPRQRRQVRDDGTLAGIDKHRLSLSCETLMLLAATIGCRASADGAGDSEAWPELSSKHHSRQSPIVSECLQFSRREGLHLKLLFGGLPLDPDYAVPGAEKKERKTTYVAKSINLQYGSLHQVPDGRAAFCDFYSVSAKM